MKKQNLILPLLLFSTNNTFTNRPLWQLTSVMITGAIPAAIGATVHHMRSYNVHKEDNEHIYDTFRPFMQGVVAGALPVAMPYICPTELQTVARHHSENLKAWVNYRTTVSPRDPEEFAKAEATAQGFMTSLAAYPIVVTRLLLKAAKR